MIELKGARSVQLQKSTDYAIRILLYLDNYTAVHNLPTAKMISKGTGLTYPFFIKIASQLKQHGLVDSVQGRNGGYGLAKPADEISLYDVISAMEGELFVLHCLEEGVTCPRNGIRCAMQDYFGNVQKALIGMLSSKYIADLDTIRPPTEASA